MKKLIKNALALIMVLIFAIVPFNAYADDDVQDVQLTEAEIDEILQNGSYYDNTNARTSGLIVLYGLGVSIDGTTLTFAGKTTCSSDVKKCGFKEIVVQRRKDSSSSWSDYKTYTDIYADLPSYSYAKSITVTKGYQYRATCIHYAKKSLLSTEKISNTSNTVTVK